MTSGIKEISVRYGERLDGVEEDVLSLLKDLFRPILSHVQAGIELSPNGCTQVDPEEVAEEITRIMMGFSRAEPIPAVRKRASGAIRARIFEFVRRRAPVDAQMLWSPKKHWISGDESAVDLAELAALQTLLSLDSAVRRVYQGGVSFRLDVEDIEFEFMEVQNDEVLKARETYISGLRRLIKTLELDEIFNVRRMSERAKNGEELRRWQQQMAENHRALKAYWYESEGCTLAKQEMLGTFKELRQLGWKGTIPPEMRMYYLRRLGRLADPPDGEGVDMVLRNLAGILLHHQIGLPGLSGLGDPVKLSFVRPADSAPAELLYGRVDLRFVPRRICSRVNAAAPWSTKGFVCNRGNRVLVSFRGWRELAGALCRFKEGWFILSGRAGPTEIRADFLDNEAVRGLSAAFSKLEGIKPWSVSPGLNAFS